MAHRCLDDGGPTVPEPPVSSPLGSVVSYCWKPHYKNPGYAPCYYIIIIIFYVGNHMLNSSYVATGVMVHLPNCIIIFKFIWNLIAGEKTLVTFCILVTPCKYKVRIHTTQVEVIHIMYNLIYSFLTKHSKIIYKYWPTYTDSIKVQIL